MIRLLRFTLRWLIRGGVLALLIVAGLALFRDVLLRQWLEYRLRAVTGLESHVAAVESEWSPPSLTVRDIRILNSPEFGGEPLLLAPELHLELDRDAVRYRELHFTLARVRIDEVRAVRNQRGETNFMALLHRVEKEAGPVDAAVLSPPGLEFTGIGTLDLTFGTLHFVDLGNPGGNRDIRVAITNEVLQNVRSAADFTPLVMRVLIREIGAGLRHGTTNKAESPR